MPRIIQVVLAASCVGLLLIIAAELFQIRGQNASPLKAAAGTTAAKARIPQLDMEKAVAEILERPLFSPARQRLEVLSASNGDGLSGGAPPQLHGRLAGVMIRPGAREALFARGGQKPITVKVGAEIDGLKIAAIEPDHVILSSVFGTQTVKPTNDPEIARPRTRRAERPSVAGMGPPIKSIIRGAADPTPSAPSSLRNSQVHPQVEQ